MTDEQYFSLCDREGAIQLGHPEFDESFHKKRWKDVTIVVCQRKTFEFTRMCIESILRFYPDINLLVVDGESGDNSTLYLRYKELTAPNFFLYERIGKSHSHGETLDEAIRNLVDTPFVIMMDSDTIVNRGGWVEDFLAAFKANDNLYAIGSLLLVTRSNFGCGIPKDENDILRYAHPACSMIRVKMYNELTGGNDNGAPFAQNMIDAENKGYEIAAYPIDKYVSHRMGTSWVKEHQMIWKDDYDVFVRPFVTFIITNSEQTASLQKQKDKDFNIVTLDYPALIRVWADHDIDVSNKLYGIRYQVSGNYVCLIPETEIGFDENLMINVKNEIIANKAPREMAISNLVFFERKYWQATKALES